MSKPDLTAAPYELDETAIAWVQSTIDAHGHSTRRSGSCSST